MTKDERMLMLRAMHASALRDEGALFALSDAFRNPVTDEVQDKLDRAHRTLHEYIYELCRAIDAIAQMDR